MGVKRIVIVSVAVLLLLGGIVLVGTHLRGSALPTGGALRAIPVDAAVVVRIRGGAAVAETWLTSSPADGFLRGMPFLPAIDSFARRQRREAQREGHAAKECYFSIHTPMGLPLQWLFTVEVGDAIGKADELREYFLGRAATILSERMYEGVEVRAARVPIGGGEVECYYGVTEGVGLIATSGTLVESAIRTLKSGYTLAADGQFEALLSTSSSGGGVSVFIQPSRFFDAFGDGLQGAWRWGARALRGWTNWLMLEARVEGQILTASGVSYLSDSIKDGAQAMKGADPMRPVASVVLPAQCDLFLRWADARAGESLGALPAAERNAIAGYTPRDRQRDMKLLQGVGNGEITLAHLPFPELREQEKWVVLVSCQSPSLAIQNLSSTLCNAKEPMRREIDRAQHVEIYRSVRPNFFNALLSPLFDDSVASYFMAADGAVLFSSSVQTLERVAIANLRGQTLRNVAAFGKIKEKLKGESNFSLYVAPGVWGKEVARIFAARPRDSVAWGWLDRMQGGALQLIAGRDIVFYNLVALQGNPDQGRISGLHAEWETRLDAPVAGRPLLMESHVARGKEVLTQDTLGNLYLISGMGRVLWKRPLGEPILGEPVQVDVYRNGKLQYAFATPKAIWVVDRNGNDVAGFPQTMPQPITAPLGVFDYDSNRNYRFMVCLADCTSRVYDANGKRLVDFAPEKFDMPIAERPMHARTSGKDFIVVSDAKRLYLLNRRGAERLITTEPVARLQGASLVLWKKDNELATVDSTAALCVVSLGSGAVHRVQLKGKGAICGALVVENALDGEACVVVAREKSVDFYSCGGKQLASRAFGKALDGRMYLFQFAKHDWRVGVRTLEGGQLWLLDMRGNAMKGFPVPGDTGFTIGHLEGSSAQFNLIVGSAPSLLTNYLLPE